MVMMGHFVVYYLRVKGYSRLSINKHSKSGGSNTFHNTVGPFFREALFQEQG